MVSCFAREVEMTRISLTQDPECQIAAADAEAAPEHFA
jgi:hypothetical protein